MKIYIANILEETTDLNSGRSVPFFSLAEARSFADKKIDEYGAEYEGDIIERSPDRYQMQSGDEYVTIEITESEIKGEPALTDRDLELLSTVMHCYKDDHRCSTEMLVPVMALERKLTMLFKGRYAPDPTYNAGKEEIIRYINEMVVENFDEITEHDEPYICLGLPEGLSLMGVRVGEDEFLDELCGDLEETRDGSGAVLCVSRTYTGGECCERSQEIYLEDLPLTDLITLAEVAAAHEGDRCDHRKDND